MDYTPPLRMWIGLRASNSAKMKVISASLFPLISTHRTTGDSRIVPPRSVLSAFIAFTTPISSSVSSIWRGGFVQHL